MNSFWFQPWQSQSTATTAISTEDENDIASLDEDSQAEHLLTQFPPYGSHQPQQPPEWLSFTAVPVAAKPVASEQTDETGRDDDALTELGSLQSLASRNNNNTNMNSGSKSNKGTTLSNSNTAEIETINFDNWDLDEQYLWKNDNLLPTSEKLQKEVSAPGFQYQPTSFDNNNKQHQGIEAFDNLEQHNPNDRTSSSRRFFSTSNNEVATMDMNKNRQHWMPDQLCKQCYSCETTFTVFRRRHHCRLCGQVFCNSCSAYFVPHQKTTVRVCSECFQQVHHQGGTTSNVINETENIADASPLSPSTNAIRPPRTPVRSATIAASTPFALDTTIPDHFVTTDASATVLDIMSESELKNKAQVLAEPADSVLSEFRNRRNQRPSLLASPSVGNQHSLSVIRQEYEDELLQRKDVMIESPISLAPSDASSLLSPIPEPLLSPLNGKNKKSMKTTQSSAAKEKLEQQKLSLLPGQRHLGSVAADHLMQLTEHLIRIYAPILYQTFTDNDTLKRSWLNTLLSLATRSCATVDPDLRQGDLLDIRPYCKVKAVPGGSTDDCAYVSGVVFRKNVSHKKMAREVYNARIMLLSGGIEFTRTENRIASLETLFEQEDKYMEILVGKILKLKPDVLLVGKIVSRRALELLLNAGVVLVQQVKPSILSRISRQTGATIISSTDHVMSQFGANVLGKCNRFRLITFRDSEAWVDNDSSLTDVVNDDAILADSKPRGTKCIKTVLESAACSPQDRQAALAASKLGEKAVDGAQAVKLGLAKRGVTHTYIMIEGCPKHLGCTVVLRGARHSALQQLKPVFRFILNAAYNLRLETNFLKERGARLDPNFKLRPENVFSTSLCIDFGGLPQGRKVRPWNGSNEDAVPKSVTGEISAIDHQSILVSSVWMTSKTQCCPAEVKGICYYSLQDVSLGQFLRDSCFNLSLRCQNPNCKKSVLDHSLSFVHNDGLLNIVVEELDERIPMPAKKSATARRSAKSTNGSKDDDLDQPIATWTFCHRCKMAVTPLVFISESTWKFSFGKFLEVFFYNRSAIVNAPYCSCCCNIQTSTSLYFGCGKLAARFTYERTNPYDVFVRPNLPFDYNFHREELVRRLDLISQSSSGMFVQFDRHIEKVSRDARSLFHSAVNRPEHLQTVLSELNSIAAEVSDAAKVIQDKLVSVSEKCRKRDEQVNEALHRFAWFARRYLFMLMTAWNEKLSIAGQAISTMRRIAGTTSHRHDGVIGPNVTAVVGDPFNEELAECMVRLRQLNDHYRRYTIHDLTQVLPELPNNDAGGEGYDDDDFDDADHSVNFGDGVDADVLASRRRLKSSRSQSTDTEKSLQRPTKSLGTRREMIDEGLSVHDDNVNKSVKSSAGGAVKSAITRFFNRGGREADLYAVNLGIFAEGRPRLPPGLNGVIVPVIDDQWSSIIAYSLTSAEYNKQLKHFSKVDASGSVSPDGHSNSRYGDKGGVISTQGPLSTAEKKEIERRMLVRNKSHIKHTFRDYGEKGQVACKFVCTSFWAAQFHAVRQVFLSPSSTTKDGHVTASFGLDVEQEFIESLSSTYSWAASGGKSGASFARTSDDRFVIKCISRTELQMFLDCAPAYFEYLSKAFFHGLPTVLCKIVGVYQIGVHNRLTGKRNMEQVAVMQNIFYNRKITKMFDLKGSLRGRFAAQIQQSSRDDSRSEAAPTVIENPNISGKGSERGNRNLQAEQSLNNGSDKDSRGDDGPSTLLDGDFLDFTSGRPMPMTDRAKAVFQMSILNDTLFLSIINVLDYSILVGIDEENNELVVGIIDFMRQYDILKQMERVGKSLPMVVGSEAPTIIQPPLYKARFTNAMERYFMTVPSKWTTI